MKKRLLRMTAIVCVLVMLCPTITMVAAEASDQLSNYHVGVAHVGNGRIAIEFDVLGTGIMAKIGASEILVFEKMGSEWGIYYSFDEDDDEMMSYDDYLHSGTVYCPGYEGGQFKIVTYFYAEDQDGGSDARALVKYINP